MAGFEYRSGGRRVSADEFWTNFRNSAVDMAMAELEARARGAAAAIADPATGRHAAVFARRVRERIVLRTDGSQAFARELERRLGVDKGSIETVTKTPTPGLPHVYLAHASEDKDAMARPLAERLMAAGIEVWFDEWEIRTGESLKRRMEQGLEDCTHFIVLLTPASIGKPWVETEIDAGFLRSVQEGVRFMGLRHKVEISDLSIFLRALRCPAVDLGDDAAVAALIADLHGVTSKPPRGAKPAYVQSVDASPAGWAPAAARVAEHLVRTSRHGASMDPMARIPDIAVATGLSVEDVRMGALDLEDAGLIERSREVNGQTIWPRIGLFVEFDGHVLQLDTKGDAIALANRAVSEGVRAVELAEHMPAWFPDWPVRRANSALNVLEDARIVEALHTTGKRPWAMREFHVTDRTRRFGRDNG
jgi:hypothetical protein